MSKNDVARATLQLSNLNTFDETSKAHTAYESDLGGSIDNCQCRLLDLCLERNVGSIDHTWSVRNHDLCIANVRGKVRTKAIGFVFSVTASKDLTISSVEATWRRSLVQLR